MAIALFGEARASIEERADGLEILIPRRAPIVAGFLAFWLWGWAYGERSVAEILLRGEAEGIAFWFLLLWLVGWTFGGLTAVYAMLRMLVGRERILLTPASILLSHQVFGWGRAREYELAHVRDLRVEYAAAAGRARGSIAFDHGAAIVRFGWGLPEREARAIVARMQSRAVLPRSSERDAAVVPPAEPRASTAEGPDGLEIVVPNRRRLGRAVFLGVWVTGWAFFEAVALWGLASGNASGGALAFLVLWLAIWTLGGFAAIRALLQSLTGCERIVLTASTLRIRSELFGRGRAHEYELARVRDLRALEPPSDDEEPGAIAFDYGSDTVRFAEGLEEGEARALVARLRARVAG